MEKYDEILLFKIGIIISVFFLFIIVFFTTDIRADVTEWFKKNEKDRTENEIDNIQIENTILSEDISVITQGRLIITLPRGGKESNTTIHRDLINRRIIITFPKGAGEYDFSNVINNTQVISNLNHSIENSMVKIEINLNTINDCVACFDNGQLFMDFFNPADTKLPVIVIDAGHGGADVGAVENGIYEKNIDLEICRSLKQLLDKENIIVYYTRLDDSFPSVEERADFVNEIMPDLFISIHSNWYKNSTIAGSSVLYNVKDESQYNSLWLSNIMCEEIVRSCGTVNKGVVGGNDIHIVRHSKVPVALLEVGFMSNEEDFRLLTSLEGQSQIAEGIYNGIIRSLTEMGKY